MGIAFASEPALKENPITAVVEFWTNSCRRFLDWQMQYVIEGEPTPEVLRTHRHNAAMLIHMGQLLYAELAENDSRSSDAAEVTGRLMQLQETFDMVHHPMPKEQAEAVLKQCFPG